MPRRYAVAQDEHVKERLRTWVSSFVLDVPEAAAATNRARAATGAAVTACKPAGGKSVRRDSGRHGKHMSAQRRCCADSAVSEH